MREILRGHFSRPLNREHFVQLCQSLVEEHWKESFAFESKAVRHADRVHLWKQLPATDCTIGINCQWHGRSAPLLTTKQVDEAVAAAQAFGEAIDLFFILSASPSSEQLDEHVARLNQERRREGQFTVQLWHWDSIEELLITCKKAATRYLTLGLAIQPDWGTGTLEYQNRHDLLPRRMPSREKKDRSKPSGDRYPPTAFSDSVTRAFQDRIHTAQYLSNSRYIKSINHEPMGHAVALIQDDRQVELWVLTPEPRDVEFRAETHAWILHLLSGHAKQEFARVLLKNYHRKGSIKLHIHFAQLKSSPAAGKPEFDIHPNYLMLTWKDLYPDESLKDSRCPVAEAAIEGDQIKITQSTFICGCTLTHAYIFPLASVSESIVQSVLRERFFPQAIPHSHDIYVDGDKVYSRALSEFDQHIQRRALQPEPGAIQRATCQTCHGAFFGYRGEKRCSICRLKQSIFGTSVGTQLSYTDLFKAYIDRPPWDF